MRAHRDFEVYSTRIHTSCFSCTACCLGWYKNRHVRFSAQNEKCDASACWETESGPGEAIKRAGVGQRAWASQTLCASLTFMGSQITEMNNNPREFPASSD